MSYMSAHGDLIFTEYFYVFIASAWTLTAYSYQHSLIHSKTKEIWNIQFYWDMIKRTIIFYASQQNIIS